MSGELTLTIAPHPFRAARDVVPVAEGLTVQQMLEAAQTDPVLRQHAVAFINGHIIERRYWHVVRPKAGTHIEIRVVPAGSGGGGGKIFRTILLLAVVAASFFLPGLLGITGTILGVSATSVAGAAIGLVGMLLVNVIAPVRPPSVSSSGPDKETLIIDGARNQARPFQPVPVILGRHRVAPAYGSSPYTEIIGGKHYLRMLVVWGIGPLAIDTDSLKIGETPLTEFDGVEVEHREGYSDDEPLTLYGNAVLQEEMNVLLEQATGWVSRTTSPIADEIGFDITFPGGLVNYDTTTGRKGNTTVTFEVEYRAVGAVDWEVPSYSAATIPDNWISGNTLTFTYKKAATVREGFRFPVPTRGEYEIRIRRLTQDNLNEDGTEKRKGVIDQSIWSALRTITNEDPIQAAVPVAKTALRIQATDQLNRIIDEFTGIVTTVGKKWISPVQFDEIVDLDLVPDLDLGGYWEDGHEITNPAALFRHVLQCNGMAEPLTDGRIDLEGLGDFYEFCETQGYSFNQPRDSAASVWETLADVAGAGRAAPTQVDGKWGVVIERPRPIPASHITPRNSFGFSAEKMFPDLPHAWRVRFSNEEEDWRTDEYRVYRPGYDRSTATKFETLSLPGVTNPDQIFRLGRFRIYQGILQPERWTFSQDVEFLTYQRGDRVLITHDVLLLGLAAGRLKSVTTNATNAVTAVTLDEAVTMEAAKDYGLSIRTVADPVVTGQVVTVVGTTRTVTFTTPLAAIDGQPAVAAGDLFGFGLLGQETDDASIIAIMPENDLRARVVAVPYREAVFDADSDELPVFETNLTPLPAIPAPSIRNIVTDESVLARGPGDALFTRAAIAFDPVSDPRFAEPRIEIQGRPSETGEPWRPMEMTQESAYRVFIRDVDSGDLWDLRARYKMDGLLLPGPWTYAYNTLIIGMSTPPSGLEGLTISAIGGTAYLRWDLPDELDVRIGGRIQFRHSPEFEGATWATSTSIGTAALANSLIAVLPLKPGTYLARVFDAIGTASDDIATVTTKQATILEYTSLDTLDEAVVFAGIHDGTAVVDDTLRLAAAGLFDDIDDLDAEPSLDTAGPPEETGTYYFAAGFDLLSVKRVRMTTRVSAVSYAIDDLIDNRLTLVDLWEDVDGTAQAAGDVIIFVRHTDEDPAGTSPTWTAWDRLDSAEFEARGFEFRADLSTEDTAFNIAVSELGIDAEELV
jgi:hypothetical protein